MAIQFQAAGVATVSTRPIVMLAVAWDVTIPEREWSDELHALERDGMRGIWVTDPASVDVAKLCRAAGRAGLGVILDGDAAEAGAHVLTRHDDDARVQQVDTATKAFEAWFRGARTLCGPFDAIDPLAAYLSLLDDPFHWVKGEQVGELLAAHGDGEHGVYAPLGGDLTVMLSDDDVPLAVCWCDVATGLCQGQMVLTEPDQYTIHTKVGQPAVIYGGPNRYVLNDGFTLP